MTNKMIKGLVFTITLLISSYAYSTVELNVELTVEKSLTHLSPMDSDILSFTEFLNDSFEGLNLSINTNANKQEVLEELSLLEKILNGELSGKDILLNEVECTHPACLFSEENPNDYELNYDTH